MGLLLLFALGAAVVWAANQEDKAFALSEDCETVTVRDLPEAERIAWIKHHVGPLYTQAREGKAKVKVRGAPPNEDAEKISDDVYLWTVNPALVSDIALFLYSKLASPKCSTLNYHQDGGLIFPTNAAECLYLSMELFVTSQLHVETGDPAYQIDPERVTRAMNVCAWPVNTQVHQLNQGTVSGAQIFGPTYQD